MKRSAPRSALALSVVLAFMWAAGSSAAYAEEAPKVPEQVAEYFAVDLVPRLIDLYGSDVDGVAGVDFDDTTKIGDILRVHEWTPDFLVGRARTNPTRATNNWVAVVSARGGALGLATVWINPATDDPELAAFDSAGLAMRIAAAPEKSLLVRDEAESAWLALSGDSVTSLVDGTSGLTGTTTLGAYQWSRTGVEPSDEPEFSGVAVSALVLGVVVLGLAIFVLLPVGRRSARGDDELDVDDLAAVEPDAVEPDAVEPDDAALLAVVPKNEKSLSVKPKPEESTPVTPKSDPSKPDPSKSGEAKAAGSPKTEPAKATNSRAVKPNPQAGSKASSKPKPVAKPKPAAKPKPGPKSALKPPAAKASSGASKPGKSAPSKGTTDKPKPRQTSKPKNSDDA